MVLAGSLLADPSTDFTRQPSTTHASIDMTFIDHYIATGGLSVPKDFHQLMSSSGSLVYGGTSFGLTTSVHFFDNMVLVRFTIPNSHYEELLADVTARYGSPSKVTTTLQQWQVRVGEDLRYLTLFKKGTNTTTVNGKDHPTNDFGFDVSRMKAKTVRGESVESQDTRISIKPQPPAGGD